jgi:MoaA/NifB/PqqE/SkfB family radical SAM enzyme
MSSPRLAQPAMAPRALLLPPHFLAHDDGSTLDVVELTTQQCLGLSGHAREALLSGAHSPVLSFMAQKQPMLERLLNARAQRPPEALTRASLLRGAGYTQLFIELTAQCNESCAHCYADSSPARTEALDEPTLRAVLEDARALEFSHVQLTGGDPLISDLLLPAVEYATALEIPSIEIYTNGIALSGALYRSLRRQSRVSFAFSFYSHDAATHDAITRTRGSQARTEAAIKRVVEDRIPLRVNVVVMDQNAEQVTETLARLRALGVPEDRIGIDVQRGVGRGRHTIEPSDARVPRAQAGHRERGPLEFSGRVAVSYDGTVYPCIFTRTFPLGSTRTTRLREILLAPHPIAVDRERILGGSSRRSDELACWECRTRAALLPENELIPLRTADLVRPRTSRA